MSFLKSPMVKVVLICLVTMAVVARVAPVRSIVLGA